VQAHGGQVITQPGPAAAAAAAAEEAAAVRMGVYVKELIQLTTGANLGLTYGTACWQCE
jgi:hypothetical protein